MKAVEKPTLKTCPFCGEKVRKFISPLQRTVMFMCDNCGADVCFYGAEHEPRASQAWNRRATSNDSDRDH